MFREFFRFELSYQLRSPLPWVVGLVFALLAFAATTSEIITIGEGIGNAHRNAPYVILTFLNIVFFDARHVRCRRVDRAAAAA
nr:hypothetical protein [Steroidobacter cummioxidans]